MVRTPLKIATTKQLARAVRSAGFETVVLPEPSPLDIHGSIEKRVGDGKVHYEFLQQHKVDLVIDFNTTALTLIPAPSNPKEFVITTAALGIPYVSCYLDPVTSTMEQVDWGDHWHLLEQDSWIKWMYDSATAEELQRFAIPNVLMLPMAANDDDFDTTPPKALDESPVVSFIGHPASSWFTKGQTLHSTQLYKGFTAAAVHAGLPDLPFHKIFYDLYEFADPPSPQLDRTERADQALQYYNEKFIYCAFLAIERRDRFVRFLQRKLGDAFELIGDHWGETYGLKHTPRIWDRQEMYSRMRRVPISLNFIKGCPESGLNLRHFEITACGGFLLSYYTPELSQYFTIGEECDIFHDEHELLEKIGYYLHHPEKRNEIARAGQRRTLSQHLYSHRITALVDILRQNGILPKPPVDAATEPVSEPSEGVIAPLHSPDTARARPDAPQATPPNGAFAR